MDEPLVLNIAICEDSDADAQHLQSLIWKSGMAAAVSHFTCGEDFLSAFAPGMYDLIFMDIYMTGIRGIETAESIRAVDESVVIAFVTLSPGHTLESYKLDALRYILKPAGEKDVVKTLELALAKKSSAPSVTIRLAGGKESKIFLDKIMYLEYKDHAVQLHTTGGVLTTSRSARLGELEQLLPNPPFLRCHRSYIVNLRYVKKADSEINAFVMKNGDRADIKQGRFSRYKKALQELWLDETVLEGQR